MTSVDSTIIEGEILSALGETPMEKMSVLVPNQSKKAKYNLISVDSTRIVGEFLSEIQRQIQTPMAKMSVLVRLGFYV